jgi:hypothetical protein
MLVFPEWNNVLWSNKTSKPICNEPDGFHLEMLNDSGMKEYFVDLIKRPSLYVTLFDHNSKCQCFRSERVFFGIKTQPTNFMWS